MSYIRGRGLGQAIQVQALPGGGGGVVGNIETCSSGYWSYFTNAPCWSRAYSDWQGMALQAQPPTPPVNLLTVAPASGEQATQTVTDIANATLAQQQAIDANQVQTNALWQAASGAVDTGSAISSIPWATIGIVAVIGILGLAALGGGSARRYGR